MVNMMKNPEIATPTSTSTNPLRVEPQIAVSDPTNSPCKASHDVASSSAVVLGLYNGGAFGGDVKQQALATQHAMATATGAVAGDSEGGVGSD